MTDPAFQLSSLLPETRIQLDPELGEVWASSGSNIPEWDEKTQTWSASLLGVAHHVVLMAALDELEYEESES